MSTITELGDFLAAAGVGVLQSTLFLGQLPAPAGDTFVTAMALIPYPGRMPEHHLDGVGQISIEFPRFQFLSRAPTDELALANAELAYRALAPIANQVIGGTFYSNIRVLQNPGLLTRDANDRPTMVFNFEVEKSLS